MVGEERGFSICGYVFGDMGGSIGRGAGPRCEEVQEVLTALQALMDTGIPPPKCPPHKARAPRIVTQIRVTLWWYGSGRSVKLCMQGW